MKIPLMLEAARANLENPSAIMTQTAIRQNPGVINLVMDGLQPYFDQAPAEILASAEADLSATREKMYEIALPLYRDYFGGHTDDDTSGKDAVIRRDLARLADDHPTNETIPAECS